MDQQGRNEKLANDFGYRSSLFHRFDENFDRIKLLCKWEEFLFQSNFEHGGLTTSIKADVGPTYWNKVCSKRIVYPYDISGICKHYGNIRSTADRSFVCFARNHSSVHEVTRYRYLIGNRFIAHPREISTELHM